MDIIQENVINGLKKGESDGEASSLYKKEAQYIRKLADIIEDIKSKINIE